MLLDNSTPPKSQKAREKLILALLNARQYLKYLEIVFADLVQCQQRVSALEQDFQSNVQEISATVETRRSVPTDRVFPQFIRLAKYAKCF